jgi:AcrR family transcriptional regulator
MPPRGTRAERNAATRERILIAAERLFAEHGVTAVSNRQIGQAADQGNTAVVGYHFGTKAELVRAILRRHEQHIRQSRTRMLDRLGPDADLRDWIACLVRPSTEHLATLGAPTWYARFSAQMMTDPALRDIMIDEALASPALQQILEGLHRCLPTLPVEVRRERGDIGRHLLVHMIAERERALAEDAPTPRATWAAAATGLIDALVGMWTAPVTPPDTTDATTRRATTEAGRP